MREDKEMRKEERKEKKRRQYKEDIKDKLVNDQRKEDEQWMRRRRGGVKEKEMCDEYDPTGGERKSRGGMKGEVRERRKMWRKGDLTRAGIRTEIKYLAERRRREKKVV